MHREGAWTPGGDDESLRRLRPTDWPLVARAGLGLGLLAAVAAGVGSLFSEALPAGALALLVGGVGLASRRNDDRRLEERERALALREEFGLGPVWTVDLMVRQGAAPTGRDQGVMWIEGGRVMYSGRRTSFALAPAQAAGEVRHDSPPSALGFRLGLQLARETPVGPLSLSFWPIADGARRQSDDAADLRYAVNHLFDTARVSKGAAPTGQWPPVEIGPGAPAPRELRRAALMRQGVGTLVAAWLGGCVALESPWIGLAVFLAAGTAINLALRSTNAPHWKAYRDARKLWGTR